ncbi:3-amino-5-hydroxybenzoate synthase [Vibrio crassostreae]|nr:3-amino-5-hydroxybenzoate synthase [Vibrio crassostreae]CAK2773886.1 3-amino-5-hydroxybenzoate synthase [Vibrio crassostreae]CAK3218327.1 3-amino-5-hydroxybenzoate synthase [Vibrio crassostreae]CAK3841344.1 3-amino-5-hydroxybenzoate synthase [Vibrio crassostreae]
MKLAIKGGSPVRSSDFPAWPQYDENEEKALIRSLHQGQWWRVHGEENKRFEEEFAAYHGAEYALTVTNGTAALEIALLAAGVQPGDEVIVPAFTFISTSMAVQRIGALPIAVDVMPDTYCIDPKAIQGNITQRTRAIIPVHMSGHFCDMESIMKIAQLNQLEVIQDAAHAHGARGQNGKGVGEWGTLACFSFQNFKLMTAGEGGMVLCPNEVMREAAFLYSNCGREVDDRAYQHLVVGINARMNEFSAAVLRAQLTRLEQQIIVRERNAGILNEALGGVDVISVQRHTSDANVHPHYMYMFTLSEKVKHIDRNYLVDCLIAEGIPAFRAYQAIYRVPNFWSSPCTSLTEQHFINACPVTEHIAARGVWIHHRALLGSKDDTIDIATAITKVITALTQ